MLWQTSDLKCVILGLVIVAVLHQDRTINMENVHTETGLRRLKLAPSSNVVHPTQRSTARNMVWQYGMISILYDMLMAVWYAVGTTHADQVS